MTTPYPIDPPAPRLKAVLEVLWAFLRLGCLSFGGPVAHLGYFHAEFVERRQWCEEGEFAQIAALAQMLPGPASSQVAFALGVLRAGMWGGAAAWVGFTLPSAALMVAFALGHGRVMGRGGAGALHGLQIVAVAIVGQAVWTMQRTLAPDARRATMALMVAGLVSLLPTGLGTLAAMGIGALLGALWLRNTETAARGRARALGIARRTGWLALGAFALLLAGSLAKVTGGRNVAVFSAFYRSGALVFGGGHVALPLLERAVVAPGWVDQGTFMAGYGAAQAVPGPLFTFAAFLGASIRPATGPLTLAALALVGIFLPGLLLMLAALPFWDGALHRPRLRSALAGVNASVVGVLFAAWIRPVSTTALRTPEDGLLALAALLALTRLRVAPWIAVLGTVLASWLWAVLWATTSS